jgi:hypothetical protein
MSHRSDVTHTSMSQTWLDVISAVDYLSRGHRHGLTVYDAIEEALRWHTATLVSGVDDTLAIVAAAELPWDDPDPLRTALERLVLHHPPATDEESTSAHAIHDALTCWVQAMADQYNDGHHWAHPRTVRTIPSPLTLPFDDGVPPDVPSS